MELIIPVESIIQNKGGIIIYNCETNSIKKQYVHNKEWKRCGWRGGVLFKDYFICTDWTDLHYFNIKKWKYEKSFKQSSFNDLHYLQIVNNKLYIVNTGIDAIEKFKNPLNPQFERRFFLFEQCPNLFEKRKINLHKNYNQKLKVKPHSAHPNCLSFDGENIYVTCFGKSGKINSGQVVNLTTGESILNKNYDCHDGIFYKDDFYLTWTRHAKVLKISNFKNRKFPTKVQNVISLRKNGWWRGAVIYNDIMYLFASDGYKGKKTTTRLAIIDLTVKKFKMQKLPVVDGIYWDTIYQPHILKGEN